MTDMLFFVIALLVFAGITLAKGVRIEIGRAHV